MSNTYRSPIDSSGHIMSTPPRQWSRDGYKEALARGAIYDKIINVIAYDAAGQRLATVRSDYELVKKNGNTFFKKMEIKPELMITYVGNAQTTVTQIELVITNLFMFGASLAESFYDLYRKIYKLEVFIGYYSDVADKSVFSIGEIPLTNTTGVSGQFLRSIEDYKNCNDCRGRMKKLDLTVLTINPTKPPPDSQTSFICVIGSLPRLDDSLLYKIVPKPEKMTFEPAKLKSREKVQELFDKAISRIFFRQEWNTNVFNSIIDPEVQASEDGLMTPELAEEYGVRVYFTDRVVDEISDTVTQMSGAQSIPYTITSAIASFSKLQTDLFPTSAMQTTDEGDIIVYSVNEIYELEDGTMTGMSEVINSLYNEYGIAPFGEFMEPGGEFVIPAIYSQSYSGVRSISMPFFKEVTTFTKLRFSSRYNTADLVDFFAGESLGTESIVGFEMRVAFSTTGDENEILLKGIRGD